MDGVTILPRRGDCPGGRILYEILGPRSCLGQNPAQRHDQTNPEDQIHFHIQGSSHLGVRMQIGPDYSCLDPNLSWDRRP